ncbi:hypothetical protein [Flavivirga algicola]|uniref:PIN domain-containing protein n=1 Tax=Flavivirga algicola TaxID=2729136 RepID=A0ABX1RVP9_9FLAO|nr:hypothetical protein [Flavivirga algicola]NMH86763.1 hypothetical protein [Flavivirga algicola]
MSTLIIADETVTGEVLNKISLKFNKEYITVEELIRVRVITEVEKWLDLDCRLVVPTKTEKLLNQNSLKAKKDNIDIESQIYIALGAFQKNGFFIIIDDKQAESLDQEFLITNDTKVSFFKLTPLVGG